MITLLAAATACASPAEELADASSVKPRTLTVPTPGASGADPGTGGALSKAELKRMLLKKTDMPEGWQLDVGSDRDDEEPPAMSDDCDRLGAQSNPTSGMYHVLAKASIVTHDPAPGGKAYAILGAGLTSLSADDAGKVIPTVRDLLPRCVNQRVTKDGMSGLLTYRAFDFPHLGDETLAFEATSRTDTGQAWVHSIVLVRVGTTLIRIARVNLTGTTPQHPDEALVRKQVEQVLAGPNNAG
ncbi:hypothetical protein [Embleya hyalina]|uniref:hypothetical protein n=1 Tax=Embleya hyalina TaxID=516124 RepID=UPI000F82E7EE|nr:hypothetical protein [Embleya hyalina]